MTAETNFVCFVEDDDMLRASAVQALELEGFRVTPYADALSALAELGAGFAGVIVSDVRLPGMDGLAFFQRLLEIDDEMQVIFTTAHGDVAMAVDAMKRGAADFFTKPYSIERLSNSIRRAADKRRLVLENRKLREELSDRTGSVLLGRSAIAERVNRTLREVARTDVDLLVTGETGTGKTHVARRIHEMSERSGRPLVVIDPGILANQESDLLVYGRDPSVARSRSGLVERAHGGTLVIDGLEKVPPQAQARLASLIEHRSFFALGAERPRTVDIRIIATSTPDQPTGDELGRALADRLAGISVSLPSLAERREDIPELFRHFVVEGERDLERSAGDLGEVEWHHLLTHDWPGNLRELRAFAHNFVLGITRLSLGDQAIGTDGGLRDLVARFERMVIEDSLRQAGGSVQIVQRLLSVPRKTLYDKLSKHGLRPQDYRP